MDAHINRLLTRTGSGDREALAALYHELSGPVYCCALTLLHSPQAAEDVLQDTFVRVFTHSQQRRPGASGRAWVLAIARNLCLDAMRMQKHTAGPPREEDFAHCADFVTDAELRDALSSLAPQARAVVCLHLAGGFTFKETAVLLNISQSAVKWQFYAALKDLHTYFKPNTAKGETVHEAPNEI